MSRWFRHYAGMMRDEKLVRVAVRAKQPVERVVWVWGAILETASEVNDAGRYDFDAEEAAYFLRCDPSDVASIVDALEALGRLDAGCVAKWGDRQFDSDASRERQKRYRDRLKSSPTDNGDVTPPSRDATVTLQETEAESETEEDTPLAQQPLALRGRKELDLLESRLREASGQQKDPSPGLFLLAPIIGLLDAGHDLESDVLPTIRALASRAKRPAKTWDYFTEAIKEASAKRRGLAHGGLSPPIAGKSENVFDQAARMLKNGSIRDGAGNGATIDAVPRLSDRRGSGERNDAESLSDRDRRVLAGGAH